MVIEAGKTYKCENGNVYKVKRNHLSKYCFSIDISYCDDTNESEVWSNEGIAYHDDCGYNFIEEVI